MLKEMAKPGGPFGTVPQSWHPEKGAKPDGIIQLNSGKSAPMQVMKQPENGRTSTTEEKKWYSFQMNYD